MKKAFTLAEVLITLGIIGIVAALTIPSLFAKYKKQEISTRMKKFYSTFNQAVLLSTNENGDSAGWDKKDVPLGDDGNIDIGQSSINAKEFFLKYLGPYLKYSKIETADDNAAIIIYFSDGTTTSFFNGSCFDMNYDTNGLKGPNMPGHDKYYFLFCPQEGSYRALKPYNYTNNLTREQAIQNCKSNPINCASLLLIDGWEFNEDYPYKF